MLLSVVSISISTPASSDVSKASPNGRVRPAPIPRRSERLQIRAKSCAAFAKLSEAQKSTVLGKIDQPTAAQLRQCTAPTSRPLAEAFAKVDLKSLKSV